MATPSICLQQFPPLSEDVCDACPIRANPLLLDSFAALFVYKNRQGCWDLSTNPA
jgi:hypothetical protein